MKYGRPDSDFMKWRWKPDACDLPLFNPYQFLDIVRGKSLAFVGDSVGRNQMQSMICLLSRVEYPIDVSPTADEHFKHWKYVSYNFTMSYFWSPFLVRSAERDADGPTHTGLFNLYLDEFDESWTTQIHNFDYLIINAGHWFTRTAVYYERRRIVGCRYCQLPNVTDFPTTYGHRRAFRTAFRALENFKGVTVTITLVTNTRGIHASADPSPDPSRSFLRPPNLPRAPLLRLGQIPRLLPDVPRHVLACRR
ncbi:hypothetical protein SASPL_120379 [Salvia splendens]|uniref:Trichome birefringence-like C-terminal domain-containing protein n=1 Tax=Salvia splendens TaxID=180675 RepID=A0A8X8XT08_SALSN|nr:hypothetical protein SASPL_120379 [Salvia splendens]